MFFYYSYFKSHPELVAKYSYLLIGMAIITYIFIGRWVALTGWNLWTTFGHSGLKGFLFFPDTYLRFRQDLCFWDCNQSKFVFFNYTRFNHVPFVIGCIKVGDKILYVATVTLIFPLKILLNTIIITYWIFSILIGEIWGFIKKNATLFLVKFFRL